MQTQGWNTWDVGILNGMVHLPDGLRVWFELVDLETGERIGRFNWRDHLVHLGPHDSSGRYCQIDLRWMENIIRFEYATEDDRLVCRLTPLKHSKLVTVVHVDAAFGHSVNVISDIDGPTAVLTQDGRWWSYAAEGRAAGNPPLTYSLQQPFLFQIHPSDLILPDLSMESRMEQNRRQLQVGELHTDGWLADSADGLVRSIHWNTIWESIKGRVCTPVSREWCLNPGWGGYVLFDWDTFFCALMAGLDDPDVMAANIAAILQEIPPAGFVPNFGAATCTSLDRSQPPVGAYVVLKACQAQSLAGTSASIKLLKDAYPRLLVWHRWWLPHRDGNGDGLLEWGSDPVDYGANWEVHDLRAAMYESGLDNSPMYDEAIFNELTHTMELADVGLNALYALDAWALAEIAEVLGQTVDAQLLREEYTHFSELINRELWSEEAGIYLNKDWKGQFSHHLSPTNFYPMLAGIVPPERASRMVSEHLLNPSEFWGEFVIPSISYQDPGYHQTEVMHEGIAAPSSDYWRGRIWGPMNFLVCEGLRRCGFYEEAHEFARKSVRLFLKEWQEESHVHENYHDVTGDGDDVPNSNAMYHWGALLGFIGIQELADREVWGGWRFGCLDDSPAQVNNLHGGGGRLDVRSGRDGLRVIFDDALLLQTDRPALVHNYRRAEKEVSFTTETSHLIIGSLPANSRVTVEVNGQSSTRWTDSRGEIQMELSGAAQIRVRE